MKELDRSIPRNLCNVRVYIKIFVNKGVGLCLASGSYSFIVTHIPDPVMKHCYACCRRGHDTAQQSQGRPVTHPHFPLMPCLLFCNAKGKVHHIQIKGMISGGYFIGYSTGITLWKRGIFPEPFFYITSPTLDIIFCELLLLLR